MRRPSFFLWILVMIFAVFYINNYEVKEGFFGQYSGEVRKVAYYSSSYNIYTDKVVLSNFGELIGVKPGQKISLEGEFQDVLSIENQGFGRYLKSQGADYIINNGDFDIIKNDGSFLYNIKSNVRNILDRLYGQWSFFAKALFYGDDDTFPERLKEDFRVTGTAHVLALSGFHVGLVSLIINILLYAIDIRIRFLLTAVIMIFYGFFAGASPSILRAVCFFIIMGTSFLIKARYDILSSVFFVSSLFIVINPFVIYDVGFVLSFSSVASITMFMPMFKKLLTSIYKNLYGIKRKILNLMLVTLSAQVLSLPLVAYYFGTLSTVSLFSNLIVVPLVSLFMMILFSSIITGIFIFPLGKSVANMGIAIIKLLIAINEKIADFSFSSLDFESGNKIWLLVYILFIMFYFGYEFWRVKVNKYEVYRIS